jgi:hypothetical protein
VRTRRDFLANSAAAALAVLLPLRGHAQASGIVHELSGEVLLNGFPLARNSELRAGQTIVTGGDGRVMFTLGADAYFLRPGTELRLQSNDATDRVADLLRLVTGALGATFSRGARRSVVTRTGTIGIRGTGIYLEATREATYACTCFGSTELRSTLRGQTQETVPVTAERHVARRITAAGIVPASFERHTSDEIARLERLAGRPNPF